MTIRLLVFPTLDEPGCFYFKADEDWDISHKITGVGHQNYANCRYHGRCDNHPVIPGGIHLTITRQQRWVHQLLERNREGWGRSEHDYVELPLTHEQAVQVAKIIAQPVLEEMTRGEFSANAPAFRVLKMESAALQQIEDRILQALVSEIAEHLKMYRRGD